MDSDNVLIVLAIIIGSVFAYLIIMQNNRDNK